MSRDRDGIDIVHELSGELLEAVTSGGKVSQELIDLAENVIHAHQVYVQLLYVGMVVGQITELANFLDALDNLVAEVDMEDLAEADTASKLRGISALNQAIKTKVEIISNMMASKDAIGMLTSSLKETFGDAETLLEEGGADTNMLNKLKDMEPEVRQRVLGTAVAQLRKSMVGDDDNDG